MTRVEKERERENCYSYILDFEHELTTLKHKFKYDPQWTNYFAKDFHTVLIYSMEENVKDDDNLSPKREEKDSQKDLPDCFSSK